MEVLQRLQALDILFAVIWAAALAVWRFGHVEDRWVGSAGA